MGKSKKTKVTQSSNQQRITSFFSSVTSPSQSVKRPPLHNAGVSPTAKRDCTSHTPGKENELLPYKKNLSGDLGLSASPWSSPRLLKTIPQASGSVTKGGVTGSSESRAKQSPRSAPHVKQKGQANNRKGSRGSRSILSSLLSKSVLSENVPAKRPAAKVSREDEEEQEVILLSDSDDVTEEEELFSLSESSCDTFSNTVSRADQGRDKTVTPSDSKNSRENTELRKLLRGKGKEKQSTPSSSSEDLCSTSESGKLSNGKEEEEEVVTSDSSEDLFSSPQQIKPKKDNDRLICDRVALWKVSLKQDYVIASSDDEVTSGTVENIPPSQLGVGSNMLKSSQESSISVDGDNASKITTDMGSSQDSSNSEDIGSDILKASQGFRIRRNATDDAKAETCTSENAEYPKVTASGTVDTIETRHSSEEVLEKVSVEVECVEHCSTSGKTKEKMVEEFTDDLECLSVNGTPDAAETKSDGNKTPRKLSAVEENDCLDILEMFGELSPFKEKPASEAVHGLLMSDPIVKKFLDEGKNKESFAAQGDFGRHLVLAAERDSATRTVHLELLSSENVKRTCTLAGTWSDTVVRDGDIIHILLTNPVDNHYHIDNNQGMLVGVFCRRRAVLAEWHRGMEPPSVIMMVGSLVHELFQEAVVEAARGGMGQLSEEWLQALVSRLLGRPRVLQELYRLNQTADALREDMAGFIPKVSAWCSRYLGKDAQAQGIGSYKWQGRITHVEEVEENIWCPRLGLKGKVDMVVQAEGRDGPVILPLELKTGRASFSSEHCGQLALYAMMGTDRRPDPGAGLLLYLREGVMEEKVAPAKERRDLICLRNDLATHLAARPQGGQDAGREPGLPPLPPPIAHERGCQHCPHKVTCAAHQVLQGEVPAAPHPMAGLVPQHTAHLSPQHLDYFRHWCLLYQLEAAESIGGGGALWCRNATQREEQGECLAWLVLGATPPVEVRPGWFLHTMVRGRRHPGLATPLASVGLQAGDQVIASSSRVLALACGSVQGFKDGAVLAELDRPLQGGVSHHYHLDLNCSTKLPAPPHADPGQTAAARAPG
ncbi:hypothetical protein O3P69_012858 [Scylla paramamosain]|uniref:DNA replication factor Dna2 N-terminal domain-containing protein n=1 Tax=Scylla paramamosain TaxID=85552 RepID=A0AAW0TRZ3_SCYPA